MLINIVKYCVISIFTGVELAQKALLFVDRVCYNRGYDLKLKLYVLTEVRIVYKPIISEKIRETLFRSSFSRKVINNGL